MALDRCDPADSEVSLPTADLDNTVIHVDFRKRRSAVEFAPDAPEPAYDEQMARFRLAVARLSARLEEVRSSCDEARLAWAGVDCRPLIDVSARLRRSAALLETVLECPGTPAAAAAVEEAKAELMAARTSGAADPAAQR